MAWLKPATRTSESDERPGRATRTSDSDRILSESSLRVAGRGLAPVRGRRPAAAARENDGKRWNVVAMVPIVAKVVAEVRAHARARALALRAQRRALCRGGLSLGRGRSPRERIIVIF